MKRLILIIALLAISFDAYAGTCTSISRTNLSANAILTSTEYNNSLNTVYSAANALDAGCLTDGTLEDGALNTTDFGAVLNGVREGCKVTNTDTNTLSVDRCMLAVNGVFVKTVVATTVTWACSGCASEAASTQYYLYAKSGSIATTLTLLISTTAPNGDGYDASSNRILGKFFNDSSSNINGVEQWRIGAFVSSRSQLRMNTPGGFGSTNTKIRIYTVTERKAGTAITYATSPTNGDTFTINEDGLYAMSVNDSRAAGNSKFGISVNSNQLTTDIDTITSTHRANLCTQSAGLNSTCTIVKYLVSGDVVRSHGVAANDEATVTGFLDIQKISD